MLSLPKHLAYAVRISNPNGVSEMPRQAQRDRLFNT